MINLAGLVGKITGKGATGAAQAGDGARPAGEPGIATGGEFAALVELAQAGAQNGQGKLRLVIDNGALPTGLPGTELGATTAPAVPGAITASAGEIDPSALPTGNAEVPAPDGAPRPFYITNAMSHALKAQIAAKATQGDPTVTPVPGEGDPTVSAGEGVPAKDEDAALETSAESPTAQQPAAPVDFHIIPLAVTQVVQATVAAQAIVEQRPAVAEGRATAIAPNVVATPAPAPADPAKAASSEQVFAPLAALIAGLSEAKPRNEAKADTKTARETMPVIASDAGATADAATADGIETSLSSATDKQRTSTAEPTLLATAATGTSNPLRTIVEGLPPVLQSELAAKPVSAATGPSTSQQLGDQVIDMGVSGQWIDRMAREITQLADGSGHSRFTLNPPHLGRLQVDLWQDQGATSVRLIAETDEATRRLAEGRTALQADARIAALSFGTITVEKSAASQDSGRDQGSNSQRQGSDLTGQAQQQFSGQGQGQNQGQTRAGNGQQQDDWVNRTVHDEANQQSDASARAAARRAASGNVRFA